MIRKPKRPGPSSPPEDTPPQADTHRVVSLSDIQPNPDPRLNYDLAIENDTLIIRIPLSGGGTRTKSGRSVSIASTAGNRVIKGTSVRLGFSCYHDSVLDPASGRNGTSPRVGSPLAPLQSSETDEPADDSDSTSLEATSPTDA